jgi:hypothetical protein
MGYDCVWLFMYGKKIVDAVDSLFFLRTVLRIDLI